MLAIKRDDDIELEGEREKAKDIAVVPGLAHALSRHEDFQHNHSDYILEMQESLEDVIAVLTCDEINQFIELSGQPLSPSAAGIFVSKLIQNSYDAGHNNFEIRTPYPLGQMLRSVTGRDEMLYIKLHGNQGLSFAQHASNIFCQVIGNVFGPIKDVTDSCIFMTGRIYGRYIRSSKRYLLKDPVTTFIYQGNEPFHT